MAVVARVVPRAQAVQVLQRVTTAVAAAAVAEALVQLVLVVMALLVRLLLRTHILLEHPAHLNQHAYKTVFQLGLHPQLTQRRFG